MKAQEEKIMDKIEKRRLRRTWYKTFMYMNIPIIGWIYLFFKSRKDTETSEFCKAYLLYKLTILLVCILLIIVGVMIAIPYIRQLLDYIEML